MVELSDDPVIREIQERLDRQANEIVALKGATEIVALKEAMAAIMAEQPQAVFENTDNAIIGLVAGVNTVMEILVMRKLVTDKQLREMLSIVQEKFVKKGQPDSEVIIALMLQAFGEQREDLRSLLTKPSEGTA